MKFEEESASFRLDQSEFHCKQDAQERFLRTYGLKRMLAVLTWMLSVKMCSIYIVGFLGQFHVNADFFAAEKNPILLLCYIK